MSVRLNETTTIVDRMVNFFVEHEDLRTKVGIGLSHAHYNAHKTHKAVLFLTN